MLSEVLPQTSCADARVGRPVDPGTVVVKDVEVNVGARVEVFVAIVIDVLVGADKVGIRVDVGAATQGLQLPTTSAKIEFIMKCFKREFDIL